MFNILRIIKEMTALIHVLCINSLQVLQNTVERFTLKTRMRKLGVRSMRAPALVRIKLIEMHSLPSHSPVCALILLSEAENLVRSFHLPVPQVVYETFLKTSFSAVSTCVFYCTYVSTYVWTLITVFFIA